MADANRPFLLFCSRDERWKVNSYLLADRRSGTAVVIDSGAPWEPLREAATRWSLTPTEVWCTHHHPDHRWHNPWWQERFACRIRVPAAEAHLFPPGERHDPIAAEETLSCGSLRLEAWSIPGHTIGQMAFLLAGHAIFTGDTLFRGSVGGTTGPGHGTSTELKHAVMKRLMGLAASTIVYPGHMEASTIGREWEHNPFIRYWRGLEAADGRRCQVADRVGTLMVRARDYDGGWKCLVAFPEEAEARLIPGSRVTLLS